MKIALCIQRNLPPSKRQDGFHPLPPEARFEFLKEIEVDTDAEAIRYGDFIYVRTDDEWGDTPIYKRVTEAKIIPQPMKHVFGPPLTPHGDTCQRCGIHSNSTEADKSCHGADQ
jgi:hypothetical protein